MRINGSIAALAIGLLAVSTTVRGETCLEIENIKGQTALSADEYEMSSDKLPDSVVFCYEGDHGKFSNNEGVFTRFGSNTWIWFNAIEATEVAEVWTFDFTNRKALFAITRGSGALLTPMVGAFVGDITGVQTE